MDRKRVVSSNIYSIGYDESRELLEVEFKSGDTYQYDAVPAAEFNALMGAASIGKYFNANIKDKYRCAKL
jgi:hypothetical protein